jgi:hypothetical protein
MPIFAAITAESLLPQLVRRGKRKFSNMKAKSIVKRTTYRFLHHDVDHVLSRLREKLYVRLDKPFTPAISVVPRAGRLFPRA